MLQQEAYPAIMAPVDAQNLAIPETIPQNGRIKTCPRSGRIAVQNFTPIGKTPADKSVTIHKKEISSKLSIPPYTTYGEIKKAT